MLEDYVKSLSHIRKLTLEEEKILWESYKGHGNISARQELIEQYQLLVFKEAMKYPLQETIVLDLIQEGTVGLMEAAEKYNPSQGVAFSLYAIHRIRGRMVNFLNSNQKEILLEDPSEGTRVLAAEAVTDTAFDIADRHMLRYEVEQAMTRLPEKEQGVLRSMYLLEQTTAETAEKLSVSSSYVRQLEKKGIRRLRGMLSRLMHDRK